MATSRQYELAVSGVLAKVRRLIQDETTPYRYTDPELLGWLNDAINAMLNLIPQLFSVVEQHTCSAGYRQTIANARASAVLDVIGVPSANINELTKFSPGWQSASSGAIKNWMRVGGEPLSFFVYPPSADGQTLSVLIVESPTPLTSVDDLVPVPEHYEPALVDYVAAMAQMKDDEHVDMNRQQQLLANFTARVKGA